MKTENTVTIRGKVVHKFVRNNVAILTVEPATQTVNRPSVYFFANAITNIQANYEEGDLVEIKGNLQSSRTSNEKKQSDSAIIVGETITKITVDKLVASLADNNKFCVCGVLQEVVAVRDGIVNFMVATMKNGYLSNVKLTYRTRRAEEVMKECRVGDWFIAEGSVQTAKAFRDGKTLHFVNYVVRDYVTETIDRAAPMIS